MRELFNPKQPRGVDGRWIRLSGLLKSDGGFTHSLRKNAEAHQGFAVAVAGHEKVISGHASPSQIKRFAAEHAEALSHPKSHLGGWFNADDGKTYLDISHVHHEYPAAMKEARANKQIALFDLGSQTEHHTLDEDWQSHIDAMKGRDLTGLPQHSSNVPGHGAVTFHSNADLQKIAADYNKEHGLAPHPTDYSTVDPVKAAKVAQAYEDMKHDPDNPEVKAAYGALKKEVLAQYQALVKGGYSYHFYPEGGDPYANTPREATYDLTRNKKMFVFPTIGADGGFGEDAKQYPNHPLLEKVPGVQWDGKDVTYNDVFRAVHDSVTHAKEGLGFGPRGEDNTFRQHNSMFSPLAQKAIASETRGQNTWVNFGPHAAHNKADPRHTIYAPQKAGILPAWARDPEYLKKQASKGADMARAIQTPAVSGPMYDLAKSESGKLAFWKMILPMKKIDYTAPDGSRQHAVFDRQYLTDLANNKAVDKLGFLLADKNNAHTMDPERWRGNVTKLEVRDDGLYGKIVFPDVESAKAVLQNPDLGVSARIRENIQRSDGTTINRGLIHVLGTLDPQVSGMPGWETADLSTDQDVLDLSTEEFTDMAKKKLDEFTEEDINAMSDEELDAFLSEHVPDFQPYTDGERTGEAEDLEDDNEDANERELVGAGADMSNELELANQQVAAANARANEALRRVAAAEWTAERESYLSAGVPPNALDLAAPVLNRPDDMVIDLSNTGQKDVNASEIVRGLLDTLKGVVDLSTEQGHMSSFTPGDDDPDKAMLEAWNNQF